MRLLADASLCTECRICQLTCSFVKTKTYNPRIARMRVEVRKDGLIAEPVVCRQCANPLCQKSCPTGAISAGEEGIVRIAPEACTGCGACVRSCAYDVIVLRDGVAAKCDLCDGAPQCAAACPTGALRSVKEVAEE